MQTYAFAFTVVDHSGFRIHYTSHLRPHDAGIMISGVSVSDTQLIPPGQKLYRNIGICGPSCSNVVSICRFMVPPKQQPAHINVFIQTAICCL